MSVAPTTLLIAGGEASQERGWKGIRTYLGNGEHHMNDYMSHRTVSIPTIVTTVCWLLGAGLILAGVADWIQDDWGNVGVAFIAFGHLVILRADHAHQASRADNAFELGKASVRNIR